MLKPYTKLPLSFAEQLQLLESRGLNIPDQTLALGHLSSISYYRLSAYWYPFLQRDTNGRVTGVFEPGTDFFGGGYGATLQNRGRAEFPLFH